CAGQGCLGACGGLLPGVYPAMNFYPPKTDNHFGEQARFYRDWLSGQGFPLLVTETNRDHHFLRLLLLLGVKLLGPYNQAGGTDFGYTTAVNNWGAPLSFQTSDYEFASLLSPAGEFNRSMLLEARILRDLMDAIPGLGLAQPAPLPEGFHIPENVFATALSLPEGGLIAGGMGYGSESAEAVWPDTGCGIVFAPGRCAFFMSNVSLKPLGMDAEITFANATPVRLSKDGLVFAAEQPVTQIVVNGQAKTLSEGETWIVDGLSVTLLPWEEAAARRLPCPDSSDRTSVPVPLALSRAMGKRADLNAALPARPVENGNLSLEQNGVLRGCGFYQAQVACENLQGILLTDAADLVSVTLGDAFLGTHSPQGHPLFLPVPAISKQAQTLQVAAEIWGHCNFDDPRAPSLRIQSTRGVRGIVAVSSATPLALWRRTDAAAGVAPQLIPLGVWLTSETPARGIFSTLQPVAGSARLLHFQGLEAQAEVYVAGRFAGAVDRYRPWLDIGGLPAEDGILRLECRVTQSDYTQPCGIPMLYQGEPVRDVSLQALGEAELDRALRAADPQKTSDWALPLRLRAGQTAALHAIIPAEDCELMLEGRNVKVTVLRGGHICGRLILNAPSLPPMRGGRPDRAYLPGCWGDDLHAYVEGLCDGAELSAISCRTTGVFQPAQTR
ncbi:MAG TPA: hypothetical protein PKE04_01235, partial [Clostridia bacterium]|nr:hypothetical protein [Clostridia bacterium]